MNARSSLKALVRRVLPRPAIQLLKQLRSRGRDLDRQRRPPITEAALIRDLRAAGIAPGDLVMVHSSLASLGNVEGGAAAVIRALLAAIGPGGTLLMPCYGSAEEVERGAAIDLRTTPSGTGKITEAFRTWPGVKRSSHPYSSVTALGPLAEEMLSGHAEDPHVCHPRSPVGRMVEKNAKILGLGVPLGKGLAVAHYLEDTWDGFPFEVHKPPFVARYIDAEGAAVERPIVRYDPVVSRTRIDQPVGKWIDAQLTEQLVRAQVLRRIRVGEAAGWIVQARPQCEELRRLAALGVTMYLTEAEAQARGIPPERWG
ncbi:MAG: AAC(3) family N-acetyltransferase [Myxococcota bacterium]